MELQRIRYFVAVAEELSFTKAARKLRIAQPPLSRQIRILETAVGAKLLERNTTHVSLTNAGRLFLNDARIILRQVAQAMDIARNSNSGETGLIRIGIGKGLGEMVSRIVYHYLEAHHGVEIAFKDIPSGYQADALVAHKIDFGFLRPPIDTARLASAHLFDERFSVVLRKSSPLAKFKYLKLKQLVNEPLLLIDRNLSPGVYDKTLEMFRIAGLTPNVVPTETLAHDEGGAVLVASGRGIHIMVGKHPYFPYFQDKLTAIPLHESSASIGVFAVWQNDEGAKVVLDFAAFVQATFKDKPKLVDLTKDLDHVLTAGLSKDNRTPKKPFRSRTVRRRAR